MGMDTDGKIKSIYGVKDIQRALKHKFNIDTYLRTTTVIDYHKLDFEYRDEHRTLSIFENYPDDETKEIGTHLSLGMWGSSVELMRGILESFGGHIKENDCKDEWEYVSPRSKIHLTDEEILEDKLYERLKESNFDFKRKQQIVEYVKDNLEFIKSL